MAVTNEALPRCQSNDFSMTDTQNLDNNDSPSRMPQSSSEDGVLGVAKNFMKEYSDVFYTLSQGSEILSEDLSNSNQRSEGVQVDDLVRIRAGYTDAKTGIDLKSSALDYFDKNLDKLLDIIDNKQM